MPCTRSSDEEDAVSVSSEDRLVGDFIPFRRNSRRQLLAELLGHYRVAKLADPFNLDGHVVPW
jgi:hypothetical protein